MFDEGGVKQHKLSENNDGFHVVTTVLCLKRVKIGSPVILHMSFLEAVVDALCTRRAHTSYFNQITSAYPLLALQLDPNHRDGGEMEDGRREGREGGRKRGRAEKVGQGTKEEGTQCV